MRIRHGVLLLLALLSVVTYMDRVCISVAGPRIQQELGISTEHWGWVLGAFILSYGLFEIPSGALGDRFGQRLMLTRIVVWWSAFTMLTGATTGLTSLLVCRFLFGAGEAGAFPNAAGSVGRWFPTAERGRAQGVIWGASRLGGTLTPLLVVPLVAWLGWRPVFFLFGSMGIVWAVVWFLWYRDDPQQHPSVTEKELAEMSSDEGKSQELNHSGIPWRLLFSSPRLWLIMAMYSCYVWGSMFFLTWFPEYLQKGRGLSEEQMSYYAALPFLLGAAANLLGGLLTDLLTRRFGVSVGRSWMGATCLCLAAILLYASANTSNTVAAVVLLAFSFASMDCMLPAAWALCLDVGGRSGGAVSGAMNSAGQAGGFVCTIMFGYIVAGTGNYNLALIVISGFVLISALLFALIDPSRPLINPQSSRTELEM